MADPIFVLLKEGIGWVQEKHLWSILGAVVSNFLRPGDDSFPADTQKFLKGLNEFVLDDFVFEKAVNTQNTNSLSMKGFFELRGDKTYMANLKLQGKRVAVKSLRKLPAVWTSLRTGMNGLDSKINGWLSQNKSMFGGTHGKVYWIVGVLIAQQITIAASEEDEQKLAAKGEVPIGTCAEIAAKAAAHGLPVDLQALPNIVGERSTVSDNSQCFSATAEDNFIIGLQLQEVVRKKEHGMTKLVTKEMNKIPARHLGTGEKGQTEFELIQLDESTWDRVCENSEMASTLAGSNNEDIEEGPTSTSFSQE